MKHRRVWLVGHIAYPSQAAAGQALHRLRDSFAKLGTQPKGYVPSEVVGPYMLQESK